MSSAPPSKKRPQPPTKSVSPVKRAPEPAKPRAPAPTGGGPPRFAVGPCTWNSTCPRVWQGAARTSTSVAPSHTRAPCVAGAFVPGTASFCPAMTRSSGTAARKAGRPPAWSRWWCVTSAVVNSGRHCSWPINVRSTDRRSAGDSVGACCAARVARNSSYWIWRSLTCARQRSPSPGSTTGGAGEAVLALRRVRVVGGAQLVTERSLAVRPVALSTTM